ncbi:Aspartic protease-like protein pynH [Cladobotryum mycophilum]|uniref:Aspartic protease-like protein pynH n=1 Tax=Cladobotryum mycophilum TaxID=491253 RepID=A0ABR0S5S0_9HYPO
MANRHLDMLRNAFKNILGDFSAVGCSPCYPGSPSDLDRPYWGGSRGEVYDMPMKWSPLGFLTTIELGTPKQELTIFVDWTWVSFIVMTNRCNGVYNQSACFFPDQITWDPRKSSSLKNLSSVYDDYTWRPNHFFFEYPMHVTIGSDSLEVGPVTKDTVLQLSDLTFDTEVLGQVFPFSGIFGLSPVFEGDGLDYQSPIYQQWKQGAWKEPVAGFVYCHDNSTKHVCDGNDGIQTIGGIRTDLIRNNKIWWYDVEKYIDVNSLDFVYDPPVYNYWAVELESLSLGTEEQKVEPTSNESGKAAIFDHASYGRGAPLTPNAYMRLVNITHANPVKPKSPPNNGEQAFYSVDCSKVATFPEIKYKFVGQDKVWVITSKNYVEKLGDGSCVLNIRTLATGDKFIGNFGETFAIDKYITLDWENLRVGISDARIIVLNKDSPRLDLQAVGTIKAVVGGVRLRKGEGV